MGVLYANFTVWNRDLTHSISMNGLVDTGSEHTLIPAVALEELGVNRLRTVRFRLSDGSPQDLALGMVDLELQGAAEFVPVVFGPAPGIIQIGATTLEKLKLAVDLDQGRLLPVANL